MLASGRLQGKERKLKLKYSHKNGRNEIRDASLVLYPLLPRLGLPFLPGYRLVRARQGLMMMNQEVGDLSAAGERRIRTSRGV